MMCLDIYFSSGTLFTLTPFPYPLSSTFHAHANVFLLPQGLRSINLKISSQRVNSKLLSGKRSLGFSTRLVMSKEPFDILLYITYLLRNNDGFGGLVVSIAGLCHPSLRVQTRPKPLDFSGVKILSMPSSGGEVKESVPCPSFVACKRT